MRQETLSFDLGVKLFEGHLTTLILAEKRQELDLTHLC